VSPSRLWGLGERRELPERMARKEFDAFEAPQNACSGRIIIGLRYKTLSKIEDIMEL